VQNDVKGKSNIAPVPKHYAMEVLGFRMLLETILSY